MKAKDTALALESTGNFTINPKLREALDKFPCLDIYAKPGTKVRAVYVDGQPYHGLDSDKERVAKHLLESGIYTIDEMDAGNWHTDVYLVEFPGVAFNVVCLSPVQP